MYENGGTWPEKDEQQEPNVKHYTDESYVTLKEYLSKYMKDVLNEKVDWQ
jgi:hypothetical protein